MHNSIFLMIGYLVLLLLIVNVVISISIVKKLSKMGEKVTLKWLRFKAFRYAKRYRELTVNKSGKTDYLYYLFILSSILFFVSLTLGILLVYIYK